MRQEEQQQQQQEEEERQDETEGRSSHADRVKTNSEYSAMDKVVGEVGEHSLGGGGGDEEVAAAQCDPASQGRGDADGATQGEWG